MKSISGKVTSTKAISLAKASKVLSNFVGAETGASPAVAYYLRRASAAFNELTQLHKELKGPKSKKLEQGSAIVEDGEGSISERKRHTKKKRKKNEDVEREDAGSVMVMEEGNRKKRKSGEVGDGEIDYSAEQSSSRKKKKKKRRRIEGEE